MNYVRKSNGIFKSKKQLKNNKDKMKYYGYFYYSTGN